MANSHSYIAMFPGCGNGRYLDINPPVFKLGMDVCCPLIDHAREKGTTLNHSRICVKEQNIADAFA